ncbi:MAG: DeoR/GlpR family DNA-binding transcription regulator [Spirochaetales bacterium]|nr:DeoR/GlpR family DNA-binding transcription regulator [Spirochaetales bacterium]
MANTERLERLKNLLIKSNGIGIKELAKILDVTEMTVRRDLKSLLETGDAVIVRGVAVYRPKAVSVEAQVYSIEDQKKVMKEEKERIGKKATELLVVGDVVFLDVGTTVEKLVLSMEDNMQITAMCFAANTLFQLQKKNISQIIMGGGYYHPSSTVFESEAIIPIMNGLRATKAFIAPAAVDMDLGLTCSVPYDKTIKELEIKNSQKVIALITSNKFGKVKSTQFGTWNDVDVVITDKGIPKEWVDFFKDREIELFIV